MPKAKRKSKASAAATRKGRRAARGSEAAWIYQAIWEGGIEFERAVIASPLKVAILAASAMADGCKEITISKQQPPNDKIRLDADSAAPQLKGQSNDK